MKTSRLLCFRSILLLSILASQIPLLGQGTAFTYQGRLNDGPGPANGIYDLQFAVYDSTNLPGTLIAGPLTNSATAVSNGLFTVTLDFGAGVFTGPDRWLDISVRTNGGSGFSELAPRQKITPAPYAMTATFLAAVVANNTLNENNYSSIGGGLANVAAGIGATIAGGENNSAPGDNTAIGGGRSNIADGNAVVVAGGSENHSTGDHSSIGGGQGNVGAADYGTIGGGQVNTIQYGAYASTISGGNTNLIQENASSATIGGGEDNAIQIGDSDSTISGGYYNLIQTNAVYNTIGGGGFNTIQVSAAYSTIAGGGENTVQSNCIASTIGGGGVNTIQGGTFYATIGGGVDNTIQSNAFSAMICGGHENTNQSASYAIIGGGGYNLIQSNAYDSVIGGGGYNTIQNDAHSSVIGGGGANTIQANALYSTIDGGLNNTIQSNAFTATICGGHENTNQSASYAIIGGGGYNLIQSNAYDSVIGGGGYNTIQNDAHSSAIGGGGGNAILANAPYSAIGGGVLNTIQPNAACAMIPGGSNNVAAGVYSLAAGQQAQALHQGSFVWADSENAPFASTTGDQFSIRAQGGVRLQTSGAGVTLDGQPLLSGSSALNANNLSSGTVPDARLSANVALLNGNQTFTSPNIFSATLTLNGGLDINSTNGYSQSSLGAFSIDAPFNPGGRFMVLGNGDVGIGTNGPVTALHVCASSDVEISIQSTDPNGHRYTLQSSDDHSGGLSSSFQIIDRSLGLSRLAILTNGNVGIGTTSPTNKLHVAGGITCTALTQTSDRNAKENFAPVSPSDVLEKVAALPITTWNFKDLRDGRHMGPMAQDFYAAFHLGAGDTTITSVDPDGVALAAIQGLNEKVEAGSETSENRMRKLEEENQELKRQNERLETRLNALEENILRQKSN